MGFHENFYSLLLIIGGLIAVVGILIFIFKKRSGENRIEVFSLKFNISDASLVIVVLGCVLMLVAGLKVGDLKPGQMVAGTDTTIRKIPATIQDSLTLNNSSMVNGDVDDTWKPTTTKSDSDPSIESTLTDAPLDAGEAAASNYAKGQVYFCTSIDNYAWGQDCGNQFVREEEVDYLYLFFNNGNRTIKTSSVQLTLYKWNGTEYAYDNTFTIAANPAHTYISIKLTFGAPGFFKAYMVNEHNVPMCVGEFELQ